MNIVEGQGIDIFCLAKTLSAKASREDFPKLLEVVNCKVSDLAVRHSFLIPLPDNTTAMADRAWEVLQKKARTPQFCVAVITKCVILDENAPLGFIRQPTISIPGKDPFTIEERVLLDQTEKTVIFVQTDGSFLASNAVTQVDGKWHLSGTYVYDWKKPEEIFKEESQAMVRKFFAEMGN